MNRGNRDLIICCLVVSLLALVCDAASAELVTTFDSGLEGWTTDNPGLFQHVASGGNPGGYLYLDNDEGAISHIFAPVSFLGNLSSYDGGVISFDGNLLGNGGDFYEAADDYGVITFTGTAGMASFDLVPGGATPPLNGWQTFSASLDASTWGVSQTQWDAILSDVTSVSLTVEGLFGSEVNGIDNVRISAVPEPGAAILFSFGLTVLMGRRRRAKSETNV